MTLSKLAADDDALDGFGLFGVVKETAVDDEGLVAFGCEYFPHPLYRDEGLTFYDALGGRKLKLGDMFPSWNPFKIYRQFKDLTSRLKGKGIEGNLVGEGLVQGGVVVFGKDGEAKYAYEEQTGFDIPEDDILAALEAVREGIY